jgi:tetrahydromethanopterin S-methyltransferase subunit G
MSEKGKSGLFKNPKEMTEKELEFVLTGLAKRKDKIEKQFDRVQAELEKRIQERLNRELNEKKILENRKKRGW